jgi:hypothetical protein
MDEPANLEDALGALGEILAYRGTPYELVIVGGSALLLLGMLTRVTQDVDVIAIVADGELVAADPLPAPLATAVEAVAADLGLDFAWFNPGPASLLDFGLPEGMLARCERRVFGGLTLLIAGRFDQIHFKLYAATDQGPRSKHLADLRHLEPDPHELIAAARWSVTHDPSEGFRSELLAVLHDFDIEVTGDQL